MYTNFSNVPNKKPTKVIKAVFNALLLDLNSINDPIKAPKKGPKISPNGAKKIPKKVPRIVV